MFLRLGPKVSWEVMWELQKVCTSFERTVSKLFLLLIDYCENEFLGLLSLRAGTLYLRGRGENLLPPLF